jgi:hypothetical protein
MSALSCEILQVTEKPAADAPGSASRRSRLLPLAWLAVPLCACSFLLWTDSVRIGRVEYVSARAGWSVSEPDGHAGWQPRLIVPEHDNVSYEHLDQARQMLDRAEWRVRHVDYENAPDGRAVLSTSPYRWWLGLVAWCDHVVSGRGAGPALERAALMADPLLRLLVLLAGATFFTAWRFGAFPAALLSVGAAALFPLAGDFIPGAPDEHGLAQVLALWSVLPLLAGIGALHSSAEGARVRARRWFFCAGVIGALGMWVSVSTLAPVLAGIALGGVIAAWVSRGETAGSRAAAPGIAPWRDWAVGGAASTLVAFLIEYFPSHMAFWELRVIHPVLGLAWLGGGELLARTTAWIQGTKPGRAGRDIAAWVLAAAAVAGVPLALWRTHSLGFLTADLPSLRLSRLPDSPRAADSMAWLMRDGLTAPAWATLLPLLLCLPAIWLVVRRRGAVGPRASIAVALGPVLVALGFACRQLSWWNGFDGVLLALVVATSAALAATTRRPARWAWAALAALALLPGAILNLPREHAGEKSPLNQTEVVTLIERDLARWLAMHAGAGGAIALAPPNETITMYYYGGVRGLATLGWENQDGLGVAIRIVSASTPEEAQELIGRRGVTHIVIPEWAPYLDVFARMGLGQLEGTFINRLHKWELPPWLRPVPYILPEISGFEGHSVTVLEVVDSQDDATAASRLAEYYVEMDKLDLAAYAAQTLRRFPADIGALVARAQVENARGDADGFARTVDLILPRLSSRADRTLPLDRRVSLAVVLALGHHMDLARAQVRQCLDGLDEENLRSLSAGSLYHLQVLSKATGQGIPDARLRGLSMDLLPPILRHRVER